MIKKSAYFYTEEQINELKRLALTKEPATRISDRLSKLWKKSAQGICVKISLLRRTNGKLKAENKMELPKGFSFDFTPKRAEMFKDHVRLYF
jgi:hypothetical protein